MIFIKFNLRDFHQNLFTRPKILCILHEQLRTFMLFVFIMETECVLCDLRTKVYYWYKPALHKTGSVNRVHHPLQGKYRKYSVSPFARGLGGIRYIAVYESSTRNAISRRLRELHKKCDVSPFTRAAQEVQCLAFYESSTRNAISHRLR